MDRQEACAGVERPYRLSRGATRTVEGIPSAFEKPGKSGVLRDELRELGIAGDAVRGIGGGPRDLRSDDGAGRRE
jgi:hypothetical protein